MSAEAVRTHHDDGLLSITIDHPPVNALDLSLLQRLTEIFEGDAMENSVRAVVITGRGKAFVAGADIRGFAEHNVDAEPHPSIRVANDLFNLLEVHPKVVVAAVNGPCLGGGNELAVACDFRIASSAATFGQPEVKLGLVPGWGGLQRLPRLVGRGRALDFLLTGRTVNATEALSIGLIHEVTEPERLITRAEELARQVAALPPLAVALIKERVTRGQGDKQGQAIRDDEWAFNDVLSSEDAREGLEAFLEKRPPRWQGR